jgi:peptidoglycan hydrolase-like protein with peptidoglycan-binding domain
MLQQKLQLVMGEHICKVDGVYGPRTEAAVH